MTNQQKQFSLKIPGNPKYVGVARLAVSGLASRLPLSYEEVEDIKLVVAEACSRAIVHGKGEEISVECGVEDNFFSLSVSDKGTGPQDEEDLGIFLIRSLMDEVDFQLLNGQGCRLLMKKYFGEKQNESGPTQE